MQSFKAITPVEELQEAVQIPQRLDYVSRRTAIGDAIANDLLIVLSAG